MQSGWFTLSKLLIQSSNIKFVLDLTPTTKGPLLLRNRDSDPQKRNIQCLSQRILVWPSCSGLEVSMVHFESINLEKPNSIKLTISSGRDTILSGKVTLRPASAGLRLHTAEAVALDNDYDIKGNARQGSICIDGISLECSATFRIPYSLENDLRDIGVQAIIEYSTAQGNFTFSSNANIPTLLPLAINVQDIFREDAVVSNFTIGTSTAVPVHISSCVLEGNPDFRTLSPPLSEDGCDVFLNQPLSMVSKIYRIVGSKDSIVPVEEKVLLKIRYRCLDKDIIASVEQRFSDALAHTPFQKFSRALKPFLRTAFRATISAGDLEVFSLCREIAIGSYESWKWDSLIIGFGPEAEGLSKWLKEWHHVRLYVP